MIGICVVLRSIQRLKIKLKVNISLGVICAMKAQRLVICLRGRIMNNNIETKKIQEQIAFYKQNPDVFIEQVFNIELSLFQKIFLKCLQNKMFNRYFIIKSRGYPISLRYKYENFCR